MKEANKDPEIKLFGKKIVLPEMVSGAGCGGNCENSCGSGRDQSEKAREEEKNGQEQESIEECLGGEDCEARAREKDQAFDSEESKDPSAVTELDDKSEENPVDEDCATLETSKGENDQTEGTGSQQKTLKKPDKILPCPRCNSMDTKFCYYNNYNVNQPRHFCKSCQRYWTAGGTMRNVPVGAGRRKNKSSSSNFRQITISEALQAARIDASVGYHHPAFKANGTVLSFGPEVPPLCEPVASLLELAERKQPNGFRNAYHKSGLETPVPRRGVENGGDDCSSGSSVTTSTSVPDGGDHRPQKPIMQNVNSPPFPIPCLPGVPWPAFPWNPPVPMPAICPPGFPMQFYPGLYWNCGVPGPWSVPWLSSAASQNAPVSTPNPTTLGKHSRDGELLSPGTPQPKPSLSEKKHAEGSVLVPKTLRIDDPDEAAKSSIWTTLGIKYDVVHKRGIFNGFHPKHEEKKQQAAAAAAAAKTSPLMHSNPAALSRSLNFQEIA